MEKLPKMSSNTTLWKRKLITMSAVMTLLSVISPLLVVKFVHLSRTSEL